MFGGGGSRADEFGGPESLHPNTAMAFLWLAGVAVLRELVEDSVELQEKVGVNMSLPAAQEGLRLLERFLLIYRSVDAVLGSLRSHIVIGQ